MSNVGPLQKQNASLSFQGGLQSKTDGLQLQPPALLDLQNGMFDKAGQLNKRFGYNILSSNVINSNSISSVVALDSFNEELNLFDNESIYTYSPTASEWINRGIAISLVNTNNQIIRSAAAQQLNPDSVILGNVQVVAWEDSRGGVRFSSLDVVTNAYFISDQLLDVNGMRPKCISFNNQIFIFYNDGLNNIYYVKLNTANPSVISIPISIISDCVNQTALDCCVSNGKLFVAYSKASAGDFFVSSVYLDSALAVHSVTDMPDQDPGTITITSISIVGDSVNQLWLSWGSLTSSSFDYSRTYVSAYDPFLAVLLIPTIVEDQLALTIAGIESATGSGILLLTYTVNEDPSHNPSNNLIRSIIVNTVGTIVNVGTLRSVGLASKPFVYQSNIYINVVFQSALQSTYFQVLLSNPAFTIVGKVAPQLGGGQVTNSLLATVSQTSAGVFSYANLIKGRFISEDNTSFSLLGVNSTKIDFTDPDKFNSVTYANNLLFVGGILQSYDGVSVVEQNFHIFPEGITFSIVHGAGALSAGQYQYQFIYCWTDKFGQIQQSDVSPTLTVTTSVDDAVILSIPTLRLTAKSGVVVKIYRTQVNETTFQEVTDELAPLLNNTAVDTINFTDAEADINIAANQTIYTTGGVLNNSAPPSCSLISLYQDRVMLSGLEDSNTIWFSKNRVDNSNFNTIPCEFSDQLTISVSPASGNGQSGPITTIATMSGNLIIFKESAIYLLSGDGPNDEGGGNSFPDPQLITQSVGCTNPNSVILTDQGLFFQSPNKGMWLLNLSLGPPEYIGAGVDDIARSYTVTGNILDPNDNIIIFTTDNGPAMVYDYYIQQWTSWTNHNAVDAIVWNNTFVFAKSNGSVYMQNRGSFNDGVINGRQIPVSMEFTTPWLSFAQMQGYQKVFRAFLLGQYKAPHSLIVSVGYDFNPAFEPSVVINPNITAGSNLWGSSSTWGSDSDPWGGDWHPYEFQINLSRQKCTSIRFKISDFQFQTANEGMTFNNLTFELGILPDANRLSLSNKVST